MLPYLTESFGNPSSAHAFGRTARAALDEAHERVATRLHAEPREIVFTSGGTEANNLALKGAAWAGKAHGHRIVTSAVEHHAVGHTLRYLEKFGFEIVELPVDRYGRVDPDQLEAALTDRTILVSIMLANNEVGTIQPIAEIAHGRPRAQGRPAPRRRRPGGPVRRSRPEQPSAPTSCRSGRTSSRAPRASARCSSATGRTSSPSSRAATQERHRRAGHGERGRGGRPGRRLRPVVCRATGDGRPAAPPARAARQGDPRHARHGDDRPSEAAAAGPPLDRRARHGRGVGLDVARSRGIACSVGLGVHDRLDRGQPRADRDGLPGGRGPRRAAPVPRADDDRRGDRRRRARSCRGSSRRCASVRAAVAADPLGQAIGV